MENTNILINLLLLFIYSLSVISEGYMDGYNKLNNKMLHGLKLISHGGLLILFFLAIILSDNNLSPLLFMPFILIRKPIFDYSYSFGYGKKGSLIIGTTSLTDKIIHKLKIIELENKVKFPILGFIYFLMFCGSFILTIYLGM